MLSKVKNNLLNIIPLAGLFAGFYPVVLLLRFYYTETSLDVRDIIFNALLILVGYALSGIILSNKKLLKQFIADLSLGEVIVYLTLLIPISTAAAVYRQVESGRLILEVITAVVIYYVGVNAPFQEFNEILSDFKILLGIIFLSFSHLFDIYFLEDTDFKIFNYGYLFIVMSMIVKNQDNLELIFIGRDKANFNVPGNIRNYNIFGVFLFFLTILLFFYFKPVAMAVLQVVWAVIRYLLWLLYKLLTLLRLESVFTHGAGGIPELSRNESNPIWWVFVLIIILLFLFIIKWGFGLLEGILKGVLKVFKKIYKKRVDTAVYIGDFIDEDEFIRPENNPGFGWLGRLGVNIKRSEKLKDITDPVLRVRAFFRLVVKMINEDRVEVMPADTAKEILEKSLKIDEIHPYFTELTGLYETVRYGDMIPDPYSLSKAEAWYENITMHTKKGKSIKSQ